MKESFNRQGLEPAVMMPEEFGRFIRAEVAQNVKVVRTSGIKVD